MSRFSSQKSSQGVCTHFEHCTLLNFFSFRGSLNSIKMGLSEIQERKERGGKKIDRRECFKRRLQLFQKCIIIVVNTSIVMTNPFSSL